ncbi:DUF302 domain-containing protein [Kribbella turkmenica]|uniref:DUF302 domain-containing protein n=1 Tax=Kribbella turkmenica TaxID=2530375 RepID=A0A4R4WWW1_9ACTN|nr:DUF302 domain-containing protein [Kribbella turkmenica]TDD22205.1 DUF302 domain-containing protein [Kribbella turkmenica]
MTTDQKSGPAGVRPTSGVVHKRSPVTVAETVLRLSAAIREAGGTVYFVVDHSGEAQRAGAELRDTKVLGFGNPAVDVATMTASPLAALDLPTKILVWSDDDGTVWMTYLKPAWLTKRHNLEPDQAEPLSAVDDLIARVAAA